MIIAVEHLNCCLVRTRLLMLLDPVRELLDRASGDERVDETVAAAIGEVFVGPAESARLLVSSPIRSSTPGTSLQSRARHRNAVRRLKGRRGRTTAIAAAVSEGE